MSILLLMKVLETYIVQISVMHSFYLEKKIHYRCCTFLYPSLTERLWFIRMCVCAGRPIRVVWIRALGQSWCLQRSLHARRKRVVWRLGVLASTSTRRAWRRHHLLVVILLNMASRHRVGRSWGMWCLWRRGSILVLDSEVSCLCCWHYRDWKRRHR